MARTLLLRKSVVGFEGRTLHAIGMYVRQDSPLPKIGEAVTAQSENTGKKYSGFVSFVDELHHTYDADIDLSQEISQ